MDKRCFSALEAREYLGLKRRSFDTHIAPLLAGKTIKMGTTVLFERVDLDAAWDTYKLTGAKPGTKQEARQSSDARSQQARPSQDSAAKTARHRKETFNEVVARLSASLKQDRGH